MHIPPGALTCFWLGFGLAALGLALLVVRNRGHRIEDEGRTREQRLRRAWGIDRKDHWR